MMTEPAPDFLLYAARKTRSGPLRIVPSDEPIDPSDPPIFEWSHVCAIHEQTPAWLAAQRDLDPLVIEAMVAAETRPRVLLRADGVMVNLRAMNLRAGADPEDMISLRMWIDDRGVISTRRRDILAIDDVVGLIESGNGPTTTGDFLVTITDRLYARMEPVLEDLEELLSEAEERLVLGEIEDIASIASMVQKRATIFTRYIVPQRVVLEGLLKAEFDWLKPEAKAALNESLDRVMRYTEELHEVRDRARILNDELNNAEARRLNEITYIFSVAATIFLPLGFLTGLAGINLRGIPGVGSEFGFWWFTGGCILLGTLQVIIFKKLKWF